MNYKKILANILALTTENTVTLSLPSKHSTQDPSRNRRSRTAPLGQE